MDIEGARPEQLVLTEADQVPPPGPVVSEPTAQGRTKRPEGAGGPNPAEENPDYDDLVQVKHFAEKVGGLERLQQLVEVLIRLKD